MTHVVFFFFSSRRRHTRCGRDWSSDVCSSDLNPHWRDLQRADEAMVVFTGPGVYVSPEIYEVTPAAPSYNYTAVHAYGTAFLIDDAEQTLMLLRETVERFERGPGG